MATKTLTVPALCFDNVCKEIHDSWDHPKHLVHALASLNQFERQQIKEKYREIYGEDLVYRLQNTQMVGQRNEPTGSSLSAKTCAALYMLLLNPHERDAVVAREAFEQTNINYRALLEICVCRKSSHFLLILQAYQARFGRQLDQDIISTEPSSPYQKILTALAASHKAHLAEVSQHIAKCDARRLYQAGEGKSGAFEEAVLLEILSKRSIPQLKLTFFCYKHIYGHNYTKSLENEYYGSFEGSLKVVVKCIQNPPKFYAKTIYSGIKGDNGAMTRVIISRAEVDMAEIKRVFKKKHGMELKEAICESIPSGDYREFLVALVSKTSTSSP